MAESKSRAHFPLLEQVCHINSSQEDFLRRGRFVSTPEPEDSNETLDGDDIHVESTGIVMISPPESPDDENQDDGTIPLRDNDVFHTPPEDSTTTNSQEVPHHQTVDDQGDRMVGEASDDDLGAANLGRDSDSVSSMETIGIDYDSGIISYHSDDIKVNTDKNQGAGTPQIAGAKCLERTAKSLKKPKCPSKDDGVVKSVEKLLQNQGIEEVRYAGPTIRNSLEKRRIKRALPVSIRTINDGYSEPERVSDNVKKVPFSLLGVLKSLSRERTDDPDLEKLTVLEVLKRRGMAFP